MKYFIILSAMLAFHFSLLRKDRSVIDTATTGRHALVVASHALDHIKLDAKEMNTYAENLLDNSGEVLDTNMFSEIIRNADGVDTNDWSDSELNNLLVVQSKNPEISKKYLFKKLNLSGKKQIRYYTRQINKYNEAKPADRNIYYFSKPVYSNSGKYAVVQWESGQNGGIHLYHLNGNEWKEVGVVSNWK